MRHIRVEEEIACRCRERQKPLLRDQDEVDPVALAQSLAREIRARHIGDLRVLRRPFCQGDGIIRALAARRCDCLNHRIILQIYKIKSQSRCA